MSLKDFIQGRATEKTMQTYLYQIKKFLRVVYPDRVTLETHGSRQIDITNHEVLASRYIKAVKAGRDFVPDIKRAMRSCAATRSGAALRGAVVKWLKYERIPVNETHRDDIKDGMEKARTITQKDTLGVEDARRILAQMTPRSRAITLIMLSSGARISEVLALKLQVGKRAGDIELDAKPAKIHIRKAKTGPRISFISPEAVDAVRDYLRIQEAATQSTGARGSRKGSEYLFSMGYRTWQEVWARAVQKAGLELHDPQTNRLTRTSHACRRFFKAKMSKGEINKRGMNPAAIEKLMGHAGGYLGESYPVWSGDDEDLAAEYQEHVHAVNISKAVVSERTDKRIRELEEELQKTAERQEEEIQRLARQQEIQQKISDMIAAHPEVVMDYLSQRMQAEDPEKALKVLEKLLAEVRRGYSRQ